MTANYPAYLASKRTVDDRALDHRVLGVARRALEGRDPIRVLEVGVGIADSIIRFLDAGLFPSGAVVEYRGVDHRADVLERARENVYRRADRAGWKVLDQVDGVVIETDRTYLRLTLIEATADRILIGGELAVDLIVGQSFVDLVDRAALLDATAASLVDDGLAYFPATFDGATIFRPVFDPDLDHRIIEAYHRTMDARWPGASQSGRWILETAPTHDLDVLAAAGADWVVHPRNGDYPGREREFLEAILATIYEAVDGAVDPDDLDRWLSVRHDQLEMGSLCYVAHQLDLLLSPRE